VDIGGGYAADVQYCAQLLVEMMKRISRISQQYAPYQKVPIWQQVNYQKYLEAENPCALARG
jgi:hypothetical protein